jgi:hypothetical protein
VRGEWGGEPTKGVGGERATNDTYEDVPNLLD